MVAQHRVLSLHQLPHLVQKVVHSVQDIELTAKHLLLEVHTPRPDIRLRLNYEAY
jgi:hypothetical protein